MSGCHNCATSGVNSDLNSDLSSDSSLRAHIASRVWAARRVERGERCSGPLPRYIPTGHTRSLHGATVKPVFVATVSWYHCPMVDMNRCHLRHFRGDFGSELRSELMSLAEGITVRRLI